MARRFHQAQPQNQTKVAAAIAEHALEKGKDKYAAKYMQSMVKYYVDRKNKPSQ